MNLVIEKIIKRNFLRKYTYTTNLNKQQALKFLIENKRKFGFKLFQECVLNFRSIYFVGGSDKISKKFIKIISKKEKNHTSDFAIAKNILENTYPNCYFETQILLFLESKLQHHVRLDKYTPKIKKYIFLKYIKTKLLKGNK